jgi:chromosome segregation protein
MTPRLTRLRIAGFKSFAEPISLDILPGLTGIVGPNGCGKSNVVEALRWAMGETSARALRGGEMDDVIFAGTTARPSRNLAEVTITLEPQGENGGLPAPFESEAELQITRCIERGAGSQFRANGRELRARDVQTLYADLASGARSSGMVSQGRVAALVGAKPEERRQVLEEAAGITGLHARRHEAELKLRAAEQNVARAEDLRSQLEASREALRKQARQAARYRNISGLIRTAESEHLSILLAQAQARLRGAQDALAQCRAAVDSAEAEAAICGAALAEAEAGLPSPRAAEAQARSTLERRRVEAELVAAEAARVANEAAEVEQRLLELQADCDSAERAVADACASVDRLQADAARLAALLADMPARLAETRRTEQSLAAAALTAQQAADAAAAAARDALARETQARQALAAAAARLAGLRAQHGGATAGHEAALSELIGEDRLAGAEAAVAAAETALTEARHAVEQSEAARGGASAAALNAHAQADRAQAEAIPASRVREASSASCVRLEAARDAAEAALRDLEARRVPPDRLQAARDDEHAAETALAACEAALETAEREAADAETRAAAASRHAGDALAARQRAQAALSAAAARAQNIAEAVRAAAEAEAALEREAPSPGEQEAAKAGLAAAEHGWSEQLEVVQRLQAGRARAAQALADSRTALAAAEADEARFSAEAEGLLAALGPACATGGILGRIQVPEGLEAALGAALGDVGDASLDAGSAKFFRDLPAGDAPLAPPGTQPFHRLVQAPPALARVLGFIVLLDHASDGDAVQARLLPGMAAVSRDGACWRWDGLVVRQGTANAASTRLLQQNRLRMLDSASVAARTAAARARAQAEAAEQDEASAQGFEDAARARLETEESALRAARAAAEGCAARAAHADARRRSLRNARERLESEQHSADALLAETRECLEALPDQAGLDDALAQEAAAARRAAQRLEAARSARLDARKTLSERHDDARRLARDAADLASRISTQSHLLERAQADHDAALATLRHAEEACAALPDCSSLHDAARHAARAENAARENEARAKAARASAELALDAARRRNFELQGSALEARTRAARCADALDRVARDVVQAAQENAAAEQAVAALPDLHALTDAEQAAREVLHAAREASLAAQRDLHALEAEARQGELARDLVRSDGSAWQARLEEARRRLDGLLGRRDAARAAHEALAGAPAATAARASQCASLLEAAEAAHRSAQDRLAAAEQKARALALARRDAEAQIAFRREAAIRAESACEAETGAVEAVLARAAERLGEHAPLPEPDDVSDAAEDRARKKFERLSREREDMGPVNLRAELELEELDQRIAGIEQEREALQTAIAKLRGSIGHLNREGRARLEAVFTEVDQHFRTLFTRMMGGGRAHLALTGSDDPLLAGLEIYAEPPGKKLSALSLLSGGEQALTALSLIFAVFRCTPAPVSVLDEVDAPLDDANVERFCTLLDDVVRDTGTRFLVVTHHQLTMSRMDRLFGVTMQERGVSRLLSVDLQRAVALVEPARQAAE